MPLTAGDILILTGLSAIGKKLGIPPTDTIAELGPTIQTIATLVEDIARKITPAPLEEKPRYYELQNID